MTNGLQIEARRLTVGDTFMFCGRKVKVTGVANMIDSVKLTGTADTDTVTFWMPSEMLIEASRPVVERA